MPIASPFPIVLGSASPRRRELLASASVPFVVRVADIDESRWAEESPASYLERVVLSKLDAVRRLLRGQSDPGRDEEEPVILVADTIVVTDDLVVLGKPRDDDDGIQMLTLLSGTTHTVRTRFLLARRDAVDVLHAETVTTGVTFRPIAPDEAVRYVRGEEGRDKAGGYAVQGGAAEFVERIDGSYTNVVGLPLSQVVTALRRLGWHPA